MSHIMLISVDSKVVTPVDSEVVAPVDSVLVAPVDSQIAPVDGSESQITSS